VNTFLSKSHPYNTHPHVFGGKPKTDRFVTFQQVEWPTTSGVDMDLSPTAPVSVPLSKINAVRAAKTWKTWDNTVEIGDRIAVRGTVTEITEQLNRALSGKVPFELFKLTGRETQLLAMRPKYSLSERALAFNTTPLQIAREDVVIDKKLEAANAR
jgi:hypothetical protein